MIKPDVPDAPPFEEPWQAEAFAMVVYLNEAGVVDWKVWAEALSAELHAPGVAADGSDYYAHWLKALEKLLAARDLVSGPQVASIAQAWQRAAHATPHGSPILLENDPERAGGD